MHLRSQRDGDSLEVELAGSWRGADLPAIEAEIAATPLTGTRRVIVTVPDSVSLDLAGAWRLREWQRAAEAAGTAFEYAGAAPGQIELIDSSLGGKKHPLPPTSSESTFEPVTALGRQVTRRIQA